MSDFLVDAIVRHGVKTRALVALLDARGDAAGARTAVHNWAARLIVLTLLAHATALPTTEAENVVVL